MRALLLAASLHLALAAPGAIQAQTSRPHPGDIAVSSSSSAAEASEPTTARDEAAVGEQTAPGTVLVHITHGPEHPTRAALGFAVARAAVEAGHEVTVFLAGDGVQLVREAVRRDLVGLGTGDLGEAFDAVVTGGGELFLSGGSSGARGVTEGDLEGLPARFAGPSRLVELSLEHDRMFVY